MSAQSNPHADCGRSDVMARRERKGARDREGAMVADLIRMRRAMKVVVGLVGR
jgi:hypothetical protein